MILPIIRIMRDPQEARASILRRLPLEERQPPPDHSDLTREVFGRELTPEEAVERILADVRRQGDVALLDYCRKLDGERPSPLEVPQEEIQAAPQALEPGLLSALTLAAGRIRAFHQRQMPQDWFDFREGRVGQVFQPLGRVGIYVPGGTAAYPSTVLMTAIPAKVAGVSEVIMASPQRHVGPPVLAAAALAGVDRVFRMGGAQAIAALAYGTESVPRVDKIVGPGGLYVLLAKKKVYGVVDVDCLAGPTETLIIADDSANPAYCAADLLAQAEHDPLASAILITPSPRLAQAVKAEVEKQLPSLSRREVASQSLAGNGGIVVVEDLAQALDLANDYAPEHLSLMVEDPWTLMAGVRHAGAVFLGEHSYETLGDYVAGPSHVLPTGGAARFASPLGVMDYLKSISVVALEPGVAAGLGKEARTLALAEGFDAHARAVEIRQTGEKGRT